MRTNQLRHATSPYLLQHANNPVAWQEWNADTLEQAIREDKPILVSIGYSSCHWCHVMEHQSFENEEISKLMNEFFVCIKVDREERPDIDQIYMDAVQAMGNNGGWPLNVFLTADQKPFFGGTYFTPAAWSQILINIHQAYKNRKNEILESAEALAKHIAQGDVQRFIKKNENVEIQSFLESSLASVEDKFDTTWGGLQKAPKFIMPSIWQFLLRHQYVTNQESVKKQVIFTLNKILNGGIYDQVGGGFARYSVDVQWFAPHFEKMLYDNAQMLSLLADAYAITQNNIFKTAIEETVNWLNVEMKDKEGAYYAALDADSEGEEGKFYVWKDSELADILKQDYGLFSSYFKTNKEGNWEHGNNILLRDETIQVDETYLKKIKNQLYEARNKRIKPGLDDKILTGWNALLISGLCDAYRATQNNLYLENALQTIRFIESKLINEQIVYRHYTKGKTSTTEGFLEDYACLIQAYISLHQATLEENFLKQAINWCDQVLIKFYDEEDGYFYFTASEAEKLIARKKELFDNVIPSSNSIMSRNLLVLGQITNRENYTQAAERMLIGMQHLIASEINYTSNWGMAWLEWKKERHEVAIENGINNSIAKTLQKKFLPFAFLFETKQESIIEQANKPLTTGNNIYVCYQKTCQLPTQDLSIIEKYLKS
ncbi:MAG: thioredoxin domain-containing protein [Chryseotalea sp.]